MKASFIGVVGIKIWIVTFYSSALGIIGMAYFIKLQNGIFLIVLDARPVPYNPGCLFAVVGCFKKCSGIVSALAYMAAFGDYLEVSQPRPPDWPVAGLDQKFR